MRRSSTSPFLPALCLFASLESWRYVQVQSVKLTSVCLCLETLLDDFMLTHPIFLTADRFQQVLLQQYPSHVERAALSALTVWVVFGSCGLSVCPTLWRIGNLPPVLWGKPNLTGRFEHEMS